MSLPKISGETARLWADPELRWTPGGKAVVTVPLVFNKRKRTDAGEWEDAGTMFVRAQAWELFAENISESLAKGDEVVVTGELSVRDYDRKDGSKGQSIELALYAIGPDLKRHQAKTMRIDRQDAPPPAGDPWGSAPKASATSEPPF